jgi:hypothetical protein
MTANAPTGPDDRKQSAPPDRRRFPRFTIPARVALRSEDGRWHWHDLIDASAVGVAVAQGPRLAVGTRVPIQIERVGGGIGRVVRSLGETPCLALELSDAPEPLRHSRIVWLASDAADRRRAQRVRPAPPPGRQLVVPLELADGTCHTAVLADLSANGLRATALPASAHSMIARGTRLLAGGAPATVVWTRSDTFAVTFDREVAVRDLQLQAEAIPSATRI